MIIEAKGIEKSFGDLRVLKGIDFHVEKSEVVSIMGASGAGKTTLMRIITGPKLGTNRFKATPQMKAPKIPSSPAQSANSADTTIIVITTKKPLVGSVQRLKYRWASHGKTIVMMAKVATARMIRPPVVIAS